jgi:anaerobic magnesium-protoporphyrin IX monomethyl ester cyclase
MNILLINPYLTRPEGSFRKRTQSCLPSLGLGYIASVLEKEAIRVRIVDTEAEEISLEEFPKRLRGENYRYEFIGITAVSSTINTALKMARICKQAFQKSKIVLGGVHPTVLPEEVLANEFVDYVIRGEGEYSFLELAEGKKVNEILGLSYKRNGDIVHNLLREPIEDLDALPFPAYHLMPIKRYHPTPGLYKRLPGIGIIGSRGCPFKCTYCASQSIWPSGKKVRFRSAENILEEIKFLIRNFEIKEIFFHDDMFTARRSLVSALCEKIINGGIDLTWVCMSRVDAIDEDILRLMKAAGCHQICFGVESADEQVLKNVKKKISLKQVEKAVALTKKVGIDVRTSFMLGNPGETEVTLRKTIDFAIKLNPTIASFNITTPYPGTELRSWAKEKGYLKTDDYSLLESSKCILELPTISSETVELYAQIALRRFYYRPVYILNRIFTIRSLNDLKVVIISAATAFKILLDKVRLRVSRLS